MTILFTFQWLHHLDENLWIIIMTGFGLTLELIHYFLKRNIVYRTDDMQTIVVEGIENTYYPPDGIKTGVQNILYALSILGVSKDNSCKDSWEFLNKQKKDDGKYLLGNTKTKPCFKVGTKGKPNKWVTLYTLMSEKLTLNQI